MRILVAIANHGSKNRHFLEQLLASYRAMDHEVDIVVLSDLPKHDLGADIEVQVGAPTSNPWSLPFAHRAIFAARAEQYDLFIYSEDDTLIEQRHVDAFMEVSGVLPEDQIAGFMRFERHPSGARSICSMHSHYRWDPESVAVVGGEVFASFLNEHSACYMLTASQLARALASGGFMVPAHEGRYDMLVSAATDPYTSCGLLRRICVSRIEDFMISHLPNVYLNKLGVTEAEFDLQIDALKAIAQGRLAADVLVDPCSKLSTGNWDLPCYPKPTARMLEMVASMPGRVLSVGCTAGDLERGLFGPDREVVAVPLDNVIGAVARSRGISTTSPNLQTAIAELDDRRFEIILIHQALQHFADPVAVLRKLKTLLASGGRMIIVVPNQPHYRLRQRVGRSRPPLPTNHARDGVHDTSAAVVGGWLLEAGLRTDRTRHEIMPRFNRFSGLLPSALGSWLAPTLIVRAMLQQPVAEAG
ncbi:MAG: methyltransferase domain-containing protein [Gammaproteobacteria bacterium]|nr:methyltransferase domain-containing protein [Gammaproteobacteria bacterium]